MPTQEHPISRAEFDQEDFLGHTSSPLAINVRNLFTEQGGDAQKVYDYITLTELPRLREELKFGPQPLVGQENDIPNEAELNELIKDWQEVADQLLQAMVGLDAMQQAKNWVVQVDKLGVRPEANLTVELLAELYGKVEDMAVHGNSLAQALRLMWEQLHKELMTLKPSEVKGRIIQAVVGGEHRYVQAYELAQLSNTIDNILVAGPTTKGGGTAKL